MWPMDVRCHMEAEYESCKDAIRLLSFPSLLKNTGCSSQRIRSTAKDGRANTTAFLSSASIQYDGAGLVHPLVVVC